MEPEIIYRASVLTRHGSYCKDFSILQDAYNWLDSENNNFENTTMIELYEKNTGRKKDGFFYTVAR